MKNSKMFNLPNFKHIIYSINVQTGYFIKTNQQPEPTSSQLMPFELIREKTICAHINAKFSLFKHAYKDNKSKKMFTGLQPCQRFVNWYLGDNYRLIKGVKTNELLLIFIEPKNEFMHIFYFAGFYKSTESLRQQFAIEIIPTLNSKVDEYFER